jgi:hypothetical protein
MTNGLYLYCIADTEDTSRLGSIGLYDRDVYTKNFKDLSAVVSDIPFKEVRPNVNEINEHQRVVEASREKWATLPVRFGTIFKSHEGLGNYMTKSYKELRPKIAKFRNKDEYGVKVIFDKDDLSKLQLNVNDNAEIKKIRKEMTTAGQGTSYFLKLRMDEALRNEVLKKMEEISGNIHKQLTKASSDNRMLRSELAQIIMNASYLIDRNEKEKFDSEIRKAKEKYEQHGIMIHASGPWAPYSFC